MPYRALPGSSPGPIQTALAAIGAALVLAAGFFFGFFILATLLGLMVLAAIAFRLRIWWLKRQMERDLNNWCQQEDVTTSGRIIEGEVVSKGSHKPAEKSPWQD